MRGLTFAGMALVAAIVLTILVPKGQAQGGGASAPNCPYGYFDAAPYVCAPAGYYAPEWFVNGAFVGAGPWFHGPSDFRGRVNGKLNPTNGYTGALPQPGEKADASKRIDEAHFHATEVRDAHGHVPTERR